MNQGTGSFPTTARPSPHLPRCIAMALGATFALFLLLCGGIAARAETDLLQTEHFGKFRHGLAQADVLAQLGKPASTSREELEAASGDYVQTWNYPSRGLSFVMAGPKKGGPKTISRLTIKAPCTLASARGIRIGSTEAEVRKAYARDIDKESTRPGFIVAGSIYGGVMFTLGKGRVTEIFLGAGAE